MKMKIQKLTFILGLGFLGLTVQSVYADKYKGPINQKQTNPRGMLKVSSNCVAPTSQIDLDINNVRARLLNGGDMWWDVFGSTNARYEIPKVEPGLVSIHSSFASGLWFGGVDENQQLKTAGQTYRQTGLDFWTGPLDTVTAATSVEICSEWDKHFNVLQTDINNFKSGAAPSENIIKWPGNGNTTLGHAQFMAPFADIDGDGIYNPAVGDYPTLDPQELGATPDQMVWWVYNDKGNVHTAYPGAEAIGLEIHALAFAFKTSNEVNDMTFYKYKIFNRASAPLYQTYFSVFTDSDLGFSGDDYVGCDMSLVDPDGPLGPLPAKPRSFGYTYNGDPIDETGAQVGYGETPPVFGIDFFKGPLDENGDELPMSSFMFFTNAAVPGENSDPRDAVELYRYLQGLWADGRPLAYGEPTGRLIGVVTDTAKFAFPGTTDLKPGRTNWVETAAVGDRRMVHTAGPFTLQPGAVNEVIIGAVWARALSGNNLASIPLAIAADDKAQILFDNNFKLANGPAPVILNAIPLSNKVVLSLENTIECERYDEDELDDQDLVIYNYKFQGYQVYQLKNEAVALGNLSDPSVAALIAVVDIKDSIDKVVNKYFDAATNNVNAKVMVEAENSGIKHAFELTTDAFASGADNRIINGKRLFYIVIPYAVSKQATQTKYLASRRSNTIVSVIPNAPNINGFSNNIIAKSLPVTRVEGAGNGGNILDLSSESEEKIVRNTVGGQITYQIDKGPIGIKVVDPAKLKKQNYRLVFNANHTRYSLYDADNNSLLMESDSLYVPNTTLTDNEQLAEHRFYDITGDRIVSRTSLGFNIVVNNTLPAPGANPAVNRNAFLEGTKNYVSTNPSDFWLNGKDGKLNSVISGATIQGYIQGDATADPSAIYSNILDGTWVPYKMLRMSARNSPLLDPPSKSNANNLFANQNSVDIVLTNDKTKWSECIVVEASDNNAPAAAKETAETIPGYSVPQRRLNLRGKDIGKGIGRSQFPGYAINVETGERLNIFFAESSHRPDHNGADMLFNPTANDSILVQGGRHYIYVARTRYDSCNAYWNTLSNNGTDFNSNTGGFTQQKQKMYGTVDWVSVPLLDPTAADLNIATSPMPSDVKVRLRISKGYTNYLVDNANNAAPAYLFNSQNTIIAGNENPEENKKDALAKINVVPNPYYAHSSYELGQNEFKVRFTNLAPNTTISIYTPSGILVRKLSKSDPATTFLDWDLQNSSNIPIASGMYVIHVNAVGWGEKILKWMCVMRPLDFENF